VAGAGPLVDILLSTEHESVPTRDYDCAHTLRLIRLCRALQALARAEPFFPRLARRRGRALRYR